MSPPQEQEPGIASLDPMPGRVIAGNFRIEKLIGAGAMGNVYKAEQLSLGKQVAIKVLHQHLVNDEKLVQRFKREAKSASMLNHVNSIQIIDSGEDRDGTLFDCETAATIGDRVGPDDERQPDPATRYVATDGGEQPAGSRRCLTAHRITPRAVRR